MKVKPRCSTSVPVREPFKTIVDYFFFYFLFDVNFAVGMKELVLEGHNAAVTVVKYSPDGAFILTGSADSSVKVCNTTNSQNSNLVRF